jgi:hypothetical protein
VASTFIING